MEPGVAQAPTLNHYDDNIIFDLPGYGTARVDCGQVKYIGHIPDSGKVHYIKRTKSCHRKECPTCWKDWQKREANAIKTRIWHYYSDSRRAHRLPTHYVISPPQSSKYDTKESYRDLRKRAYEIGKLRGIKGGVMMFHQRSDRYNDKDTYSKIHCSEGPHFHVIGDGWLSQATKEFFLKEGWILKNLRVRSMNQVFGTALYILDHCAIAHRNPEDVYPAISQSTKSTLTSITWFGSMSYNKLKIEKRTGSETIYCPICETEISKDDWYELYWVRYKDPPPDDYGESTNDKNGFQAIRTLTGWSDPLPQNVY